MANADLTSRLDQRLKNGVTRLRIGDAQRAFGAAISCITITLIGFDPLEEGQHIRVAPAAIAHLRPGIEILRLPAHESQAIDSAGPTQDAPARHRQAPSIGGGFRFGGVEPIHIRIIDHARIANGNARPAIAAGARFQQQHLIAWISR